MPSNSVKQHMKRLRHLNTEDCGSVKNYLKRQIIRNEMSVLYLVWRETQQSAVTHMSSWAGCHITACVCVEAWHCVCVCVCVRGWCISWHVRETVSWLDLLLSVLLNNTYCEVTRMVLNVYFPMCISMNILSHQVHGNSELKKPLARGRCFGIRAADFEPITAQCISWPYQWDCPRVEESWNRTPASNIVSRMLLVFVQIRKGNGRMRLGQVKQCEITFFSPPQQLKLLMVRRFSSFFPFNFSHQRALPPIQCAQLAEHRNRN